MAQITPGYETISIKDFNTLVRAKKFSNGPEIEPDEYGAPYSPRKEVRGTLKDGRKVRSET